MIEEPKFYFSYTFYTIMSIYTKNEKNKTKVLRYIGVKKSSHLVSKISWDWKIEKEIKLRIDHTIIATNSKQILWCSSSIWLGIIYEDVAENIKM